MTGFNHVLTGVAIAVVVKQPILASFFALLSHFILDMVPHFGSEKFVPWTRHLIGLLIFDAMGCISALILGFTLFPEYAGVIALCAAFATLPDWLWILHYGMHVQHKFFDFHQDIQRYEQPWGAWTEAIYTMLIVAVLFTLK